MLDSNVLTFYRRGHIGGRRLGSSRHKKGARSRPKLSGLPIQVHPPPQAEMTSQVNHLRPPHAELAPSGDPSQDPLSLYPYRAWGFVTTSPTISLVSDFISHSLAGVVVFAITRVEAWVMEKLELWIPLHGTDYSYQLMKVVILGIGEVVAVVAVAVMAIRMAIAAWKSLFKKAEK